MRETAGADGRLRCRNRECTTNVLNSHWTGVPTGGAVAKKEMTGGVQTLIAAVRAAVGRDTQQRADAAPTA